LRDKGDDPSTALGLLNHAREMGLRRFDTANTYGGGVSETVLGQWLRGQTPRARSELEIATKVGNPNGAPPGVGPLSRAEVARHLDTSLSRLGLERIDLYYLHEFDRSTPLEETLEALDRAFAAGKIAAFGVSNASAEDLGAVLASLGEGRLRSAFKAVQNGFNLLEQGGRLTVIPLAAAAGLSYIAFSPLAGGLLTGKYQRGDVPAAGTRLDAAPELYRHLLTPKAFEAIAELRRDAAASGGTVAGAALRFILGVEGVGGLIIAPRSIEQMQSYFCV
jgi:aryl-alcohol dehydrogenase-like predicted oxidoreductase